MNVSMKDCHKAFGTTSEVMVEQKEKARIFLFKIF